MNPQRPSSIADRTHRQGFTLVEMVIVAAIALVLLGILLPAASSLWSQRNIADAENLMRGLLMTSRGQAMQSDGGDTGLFYYLDANGIQRVVGLRNGIDPTLVPSTPQQGNTVGLDVFHVTSDRDNSFPLPMRVVPQRILDRPTLAGIGSDPERFEAAEIARKDIQFSERGTANERQRHRNYFTMIHSTKGQLIRRENVLIQDPDRNKDGFGDRTGLQVGDGASGSARVAAVRRYFLSDGTVGDIDRSAASYTPTDAVDDLITEMHGSTPVAMNFASVVDGVLVYDDAVFNRLRTGNEDHDGEAMRDFLLSTAQPFYVSRLTGAVIRGPVGEGTP